MLPLLEPLLPRPWHLYLNFDLAEELEMPQKKGNIRCKEATNVSKSLPEAEDGIST
jgi:hypothetical protein